MSKTYCAGVQGFSGGDSSGSEDEDMDSEDEEVDMGEVGVPFSLQSLQRQALLCSLNRAPLRKQSLSVREG